MQSRLQNQYFSGVEYVQVVPQIDEMEHATDRGSRKTLQSTVHEKSDFLKFHGKLKLVDGLAIKFNEISSLARISLLRGAALINYMTRRALCL